MTYPLNARTRGLILIGLVLSTLGGAVLLGQTLLPFYVAFALVYLLNPAVTAIARRRFREREVGRLSGILVVYAVFFMAMWALGFIIFPQLYKEFARLAQLAPKELLHFEREVLPALVAQWQAQLNAYSVPVDLQKSLQDATAAFTSSLQGEVSELPKRARDLVAGIFSAVLSMVLIFMLTGFLLYDLPRLKVWLHRLIPEEYRTGIEGLVRDIDRGLSGAVRGQLGVCLVNGVLTSLGLLLLNVKFAFTLGILAGCFSLIPVFGSLVSTIPAVAVALSQSWISALLVLLWIMGVHLLEANFLNPKIIGHNAELHPTLVVLALLIGEHYGGAVGLLIAVPIATVIRALSVYTLGRLLLPRREAPASEFISDPTPAEPPQVEELLEPEGIQVEISSS